jgi:hypothetical protein
MTLGITTFSITILSIMGLLATLGINDIQHNNTAMKLSAAFNFLLC